MASHAQPYVVRSEENQVLQEYCDHVTENLFFLAASPQMVRIRQQILQMATLDEPVFIYGESGVGKEVLARMIHMRSARCNQPFVKVNCAALPGELLESELYGYEQGAFTGAVRSAPGRFEMANKGTILLDEIAEMSPHLQAKLLHVLQDHQYSRLGGRHIVKVDVRVLAATNVDIQKAMQSGRLREDLYYRLNVFSIHVPPLRERIMEIPLLFRHFLNKYAERLRKEVPIPSEHLLETAMHHSWPGNLRELESFVKRYVIFEDDEGSSRELLEMAAVREHVYAPQTHARRETNLKALVRDLKDGAEAEVIADALKNNHWCRKQTATMLGISIRALSYKIRQFGLGDRHREKSQRSKDTSRIFSATDDFSSPVAFVSQPHCKEEIVPICPKGSD